MAQGKNNSTVSNYVKECFAKPLDINITKSGIVNSVLEYKYSFQDRNETLDIISINDRNGTLTQSSPAAGGLLNFTTHITNSFQKGFQGRLETVTSLNYNREVNATVNPERVTFGAFEASDPNNFFNADLVADKTAQGFDDINKSSTESLEVTHYYGKAHAGRQRFEVHTDAPYTTNIYYEVFCFGIINENQCNPGLLQNPANLRRTDDARWYINTNHTTAKDGNVSSVVQADGSNRVNVTTPIQNNPTTVNLTYNGTRGYPYKTTMDINTANWLLYNRYDANVTANQFPVEFERAGTGWSGEHETNTITIDTGTVKTNRRSMW